MAIDARKHGGSVSVRIDLNLDGRAVPVEATLTGHGLALRGVSHRLSLYGDWPMLIRRMAVPRNALSRFLADPAGLLGGKKA